MTGFELASMCIVGAASLGMWIWRSQRFNSERQLAMGGLHQTLTEQGCEVTLAASELHWTMPGHAGHHRVRLENRKHRQKGHVADTTLTVPVIDCPPLTLRRHADDNPFKLFEGVDIQVGEPLFDRTWRIQGKAFETRMALTRPAQEQVASAAPQRLEVRGSTMTVKWEDRETPSPRELSRRVLACLELRASLRDGGWTSLSEGVGLRLVRRGLLDGVVRGIPVEVRYGSEGTRIRAAVPSPFTATRKDARQGVIARPWPTNNPVLDQLLLVGGDASLAASVLAREELVGALLAVVHGWPGSRLDRDGVLLSAPDPLVDEALSSALEQVVALARVLKP